MKMLGATPFLGWTGTTQGSARDIAQYIIECPPALIFMTLQLCLLYP